MRDMHSQCYCAQLTAKKRLKAHINNKIETHHIRLDRE